MKELLIVLSTYNGEKYLTKQIDSLLNQEGVDFDILIRDDGSSDSTIDIIKHYNNPKIKLIEGHNIGYIKSFLLLLKEARNYQYCAFSDQDDIWGKNKCIDSINRIKEYCESENSHKAVLYYSNALLIDKDDNIIGNLYDVERYQAKNGEILFCSNGSGFTYVMNKPLIDLINRSDQDVFDSHDRWIQYVARYCGTVLYDHTPSNAMHRVHDNNTSNNIIRRYSIKDTMIDVIKGNSKSDKIAGKLLELYSDVISEKDKETLEIIANYTQGVKSKMRMLFNANIKRETIKLTLLLKARIIFESV